MKIILCISCNNYIPSYYELMKHFPNSVFISHKKHNLGIYPIIIEFHTRPNIYIRGMQFDAFLLRWFLTIFVSGFTGNFCMVDFNFLHYIFLVVVNMGKFSNVSLNNKEFI